MIRKNFATSETGSHNIYRTFTNIDTATNSGYLYKGSINPLINNGYMENSGTILNGGLPSNTSNDAFDNLGNLTNTHFGNLINDGTCSPSAAAWLTIAVQIGFVCGAVIASVLNLSDIISPRRVILAGAPGAAIANLLIAFASRPIIGIPRSPTNRMWGQR